MFYRLMVFFLYSITACGSFLWAVEDIETGVDLVTCDKASFLIIHVGYVVQVHCTQGMLPCYVGCCSSGGNMCFRLSLGISATMTTLRAEGQEDSSPAT